MSSTSGEAWPPQLKKWVAECLGKMNDTNRPEASAELRKVIADSFASKTMWTTDWAAMELASLTPKPLITSLKRKSVETPPTTKKAKKNASKQSHPSPLDPNDQAALNRRAERFQREHDIERQKSAGGPSYLKANSRNSHLFNNGAASRGSSPGASSDDHDMEADPNVPNWDRHTIVGTSTEIFKDYLRLTTEPKPEQIRPYDVLQITLEELKKKWKAQVEYPWMCSQLKSLRQDLTVQRIKNEFTVKVYEIHARMALERKDMVEYNQCQASLKTLYDMDLPGNTEEFTAYRILQLLHGRNRSELNFFLGQLSPRQKRSNAVAHALGVQKALSMGNYHILFTLYDSAPNMGAYIMDHFIDRERAKALMVITKAYQTIPVAFIKHELVFNSFDATVLFLTEHSCAVFKDPAVRNEEKILNCRPSAVNLVKVFEEKYRKVQIKGAI